MRTHVLMSVGAVALTVSLASCRAPGQRHDAIEQAAERRGDVIVSGCLDEQANHLVLTNAILAHEEVGVLVHDGGEPPPPRMGEPGTTGTIPVLGTGPSYVLETPADIDLRRHVGSQIQVTGRVVPADDDPVGTTGETAPAVVAEIDAAGSIVAEQVRLIAGTCM